MDETEKIIIDRIKNVRINFAGDRGRKNFAGLLGISPSTYSYYERDRIPPISILLKICQVVNIDLNWLLTGKNRETGEMISGQNQKIILQTRKIIEKQPKSIDAISAFLNLLDEKFNLENKIQLNENSKTANGWIPVLGRTAAGVPGFWNKSIGTDSKITETQIEQLVKKHLNSSVVNSINADVAVDSQTRAVIQALNNSQANLIQTVGGNDEIIQFIDCPDINKLYPNCFALQIDGDSMAPRINDGDAVVVCPSLSASDGLPAVVRISEAIGVTCKLVRMADEMVHLIPINEKYDAKIVKKKDILWALAVICHIKLKNVDS